jgi:GT2 family glycosyltransferase
MPRSALDGRRPGRLANLPRRIYLTFRYRGWKSAIYRTLIFPLRLTPLDRWLPVTGGPEGVAAQARRWYRRHGRPVTVVIPSYRDAELVAALVAKIRQTTPAGKVHIIVADDASGPEHLAALRAIEDIEVIAGEPNGGFSINVNRGLHAADPEHDVVLLNSDVVPLRDWLACLQCAATTEPAPGIVGAKLLYPNQRIQYGGTIRNAQAPEWYDHRFRGKPSGWGPANVAGPTLAATAAAMYVRHEVLDAIGSFDEAYPMGYEDVDYCLRAWQAGFEVRYEPSAQLHHLESATRGFAVGERELESQRVFWRRWRAFVEERAVMTPEGRLRIRYVTEDTIVAGGHRVVFEQLNGLAARGHDVELWTLAPPPRWFELRCPVRTFADYSELEAALASVDALKIATWWRTALPVWRASVVRGIPVYLVQDIETSYYPDAPRVRHHVLDTYRPEFRYLAGSKWIQEQLAELGLTATAITPGIDLDTFRPREEIARRPDVVLAVGRANQLKNLPLTLKAWRRLPEPRPELCLFGSEPELASEPGIRYVLNPTDDEVGALMASATVFVQTSRHEGFCLPALEAMASATAVVCTDAHGNRDFCQDSENCLIPGPDAAAVSSALHRVLRDPDLRGRLGQAGRATAEGFGWPQRIATLEQTLMSIAGDGTSARPVSAARGPRRPGEPHD